MLGIDSPIGTSTSSGVAERCSLVVAAGRKEGGEEGKKGGGKEGGEDGRKGRGEEVRKEERMGGREERK